MKPLCFSVLLCLALFASCLASGSSRVSAADGCSGHGHSVAEGKCLCTSPLPKGGASGWIGDACDQEVHPFPANGTVTAHINKDQTVCWATSTLTWEVTAANFFSIKASLGQGSKSAVNVHGLTARPTAWHPNATVHYPNSTEAWEFTTDVKPGDLRWHQLLGQPAQRAQHEGLFLCATNPKDAPSPDILTLHTFNHSCLDDCNNWRGKARGKCGVDGHCVCEKPWMGASCDVSAPNSTASACVAGSMQPHHTEGTTAPGTCWKACNTTSGKYDAQGCANFTCDPMDSTGKPQRRKGKEEACVTDQCLPGSQYTFPDISGNFVCEKKCACPADGSSCEVDPVCMPDTIHCLNGLVLITHPDGRAECGPSTELSCEEGTLRQDFTLEGGSVFGVCVCGGKNSTSTRRGRALKHHKSHHAHRFLQAQALNCSFTSPIPPAHPKDAIKADGGVVVCEPGHELVGAQPNSIKLSDGKKLDGGGRCVPITHIHKGVSPPLVFLWCLFSVALGPALVVLVRRAYVWHMARQINGGGDSEGGLTESLLGTVRTGWDSLMDRFRGATGGGSRDRGYGDADPNSW